MSPFWYREQVAGTTRNINVLQFVNNLKRCQDDLNLEVHVAIGVEYELVWFWELPRGLVEHTPRCVWVILNVWLRVYIWSLAPSCLAVPLPDFPDAKN